MKAIIRYSVSAIDFLKEVVSWLRHTKCDCINRNLAHEQALAYEPALAYVAYEQGTLLADDEK